MTKRVDRISRLASHALRHAPAKYGLELDREGWVRVEAFLAAVHRQGPTWTDVTRDDLALMIERSAKKRHELDGDRIRARYVHLADNIADARAVGRRKSPDPVILEVDTAAAADAGTRFALGNDTIWLADAVGPGHLTPLA